MKKQFLMIIGIRIFQLIAADSWVYNLDEGTAIRTANEVVTNFSITRERSIDPVEMLPEDAEEGVWYPILRTGTLTLQASDSDEKINGHPFQVMVSELKYEMVDGTVSTHAHYGEAYEKISKFKKRAFYKCWECEGTELLMRVLRRASASDEETILSESSVGFRHERKHYIKDFTNPEEQDYGTGKITPAPQGVGGVNKQMLENTFKSLKGKLGI